ncbi:MAG TPA: phospholipase D-like domain-containing protein [Geobacteraceae bacterium]|nr:phospholipase D-like domain-containing protein [Geobacteraceae bacterium]
MPRLCRIAAVILLVANLSALPVLAGEKSHPGRVTMLPDHTLYDALLSGIRRAKKEIKGCFFIFKATNGHGNLPMALVEELIAARKRGVNVVIELEQDALGKGSVYEQNRRAATLLSEGGVKVRFDAPKTTTHVKALVIDRRFVYLGSHNLTQSALKYNNELSVMIDSQEIADEVSGYLDNL